MTRQRNWLGLLCLGVLLVASTPLTAGGAEIGSTSIVGLQGQAGPGGGPEFLPTWSSALSFPPGQGVVRYGWAQCPTYPNSVFIFSGIDENFTETTNSWRYDVIPDTWTPLAPIPTAAQGPSAVCWQDEIFVLGGGSDQHFIYDVAGDSWSTGATLPRTVWGAAVGAWDGLIFMVGGDDDFSFGGVSDEVNVYDVATDNWIGTGSPMPESTSASGWGQAGPMLFVIGGWGDLSPDFNVVVSQRYDMSTDTWSAGPAFPSGRADLAFAVGQNHLFAIGGDADGGGPFDATNIVEQLLHADWPGGSWMDTGDPLPTALTSQTSGACTMAVSGGEIWSQGGYDGAAINGLNYYRAIGEPCYRDPADVLIIQDFEPWGLDSVKQVLTALDIPFHEINSSQMATADFAPYSLIVVSSVQGDPFYTNWNANIARITQFVGDGGWLMLNACTQPNTIVPLVPGGTIANSELDGINHVAEPGHPWVRGVPTPLVDSFSSHNYFTNLLPGTTVVATSDINGLPTLLDYELGFGRVMVSGMPLEFAWENAWDAAPILENAIRDMHPAIFTDGFESGDVSAWSSSVP